MTIFSANPISVAVMGIALGIGKIVGTVWLKQNWNIAPLYIKIYLLIAIFILMFITSIGIFGLLSKAHSDQSLVSGDVSAKIAVYDEKIKTAKENIDANRKALKQMDESVDQVMGRSTDEKGADKAVALRRAQQKERGRLIAEIETYQKTVSSLNEERAPIAAEVRKVEAEVGPIKYIAQFVYGETNEGLLEKAVTWVIIILIVVFDPLAVILLLSSQVSFQNFREREDSTPNYEPDDGPLTEEQIEQIKESVNPHEPGWMFNKPIDKKSILEQHPYLNKPFSHFENLKPMVYNPELEKMNDRSAVHELVEPITPPKEETLFVQNEEQKESNLWSSTVSTPITPEEYMKAIQAKIELEPKIAKFTALIKSGRTEISSVPEDIREEVRKRM
jgi:hypothetical protein